MTPQIDYRAAFKKLPGAVALLSPELVILDVSEGYLDAAGRSSEEIVGRNILEAFPENPRDPEGGGQSDLRESLETVFATGDMDLMNPIRYDVEDPGNPGRFEERYWAVANTPVHGPDGQVVMIVHMAQEVTHLVRTTRVTNC